MEEKLKELLSELSTQWDGVESYIRRITEIGKEGDEMDDFENNRELFNLKLCIRVDSLTGDRVIRFFRKHYIEELIEEFNKTFPENQIK